MATTKLRFIKNRDKEEFYEIRIDKFVDMFFASDQFAEYNDIKKTSLLIPRKTLYPTIYRFILSCDELEGMIDNPSMHHAAKAIKRRMKIMKNKR
jgi:hypothetical protein